MNAPSLVADGLEVRHAGVAAVLVNNRDVPGVADRKAPMDRRIFFRQ